MSEPTEQEIQDAIEMLGKGYEHPAVIITPPTIEIAMGDEPGFVQTRTPAFVKVSTAFKKHMINLKGARLAIWLYLALSINDHGTAYPSMETIERDTGYSNRAIIDVVRDLEASGYLSVKRRSGTSHLYKINGFAAIGKAQPTCELSSHPTCEETSHPPVNFSTPTCEETSHKPDINQTNKPEIKHTAKPDFVNLTVMQAASLPEIRIYNQATGMIPGQGQWETVWETIRALRAEGKTITAEKIRPFYLAWTARGYNEHSLNWLTDWVRDGKIPEKGPKDKPQSGKPARGDNTKFFEDLARA